MCEGLKKGLLEHAKVLNDLELSARLHPDKVLTQKQVISLLEKSQTLCQLAYDVTCGKA